jgi:hypothetical protein
VNKRIAALLVSFSFLSISIVHACSGLDRMHLVSLHQASHEPMVAGHPCDQTKRDDDLCKSVRYRMLTVQAEWPPQIPSLFPSTLPDAISVEDLSTTTLSSAAPPGIPAESLLNHSPRSSHTVLRI